MQVQNGGEDSIKTVNCLRGRLLAERVASRNATEKADQLRNKLLEVEKMLKQEAKSRNKAERKLKILMNRLQSLNISYVANESETGSNQDPIFPTISNNSDRNEDSLTSEKQVFSDDQRIEGLSQEDDQEYPYEHIDNSMALIAVDTPPHENQTVDPEILDHTVKEVLDALRHAKEQLQSSMQRKRISTIIKVG
ncbi:PREDICTED: uncharacterized protein LOC105952778 isoform X2 [Erythranthe guttata]|uniref:uncharacterized protein LOC105952778 isoform X2 n=1 Tax=Erythranthe guttata TaxID=4155 RepID=UPI00064E0D7D|nr:PREDICTED: uncharacterized protein LOC105952778 isoform X2 [Erythranthe guttata]|eukprot:XP_012831811.1 PREDICTED: uncharacterized protein LOC105952778 isoform X2 [Erythranthe guttata]